MLPIQFFGTSLPECLRVSTAMSSVVVVKLPFARAAVRARVTCIHIKEAIVTKDETRRGVSAWRLDLSFEMRDAEMRRILAESL